MGLPAHDQLPTLITLPWATVTLHWTSAGDGCCWKLTPISWNIDEHGQAPPRRFRDSGGVYKCDNLLRLPVMMVLLSWNALARSFARRSFLQLLPVIVVQLPCVRTCASSRLLTARDGMPVCRWSLYGWNCRRSGRPACRQVDSVAKYLNTICKKALVVKSICVLNTVLNTA